MRDDKKIGMIQSRSYSNTWINVGSLATSAIQWPNSAGPGVAGSRTLVATGRDWLPTTGRDRPSNVNA